MSSFSKVLWSEGTFLSPQHFQQSDRFHESHVHSHVKLSRSNFYGYFSLGFFEELLAESIFKLKKLQVIFKDGTIYTPSEEELNNISLSVPPNITSTVYLVLSRMSDNQKDTAFQEDSQPKERYCSYEKQVHDTVDQNSSFRVINLSRLNVRLALDDNIPHDATILPIAEISTNNKGVITVDNKFIPPSLCSQNNSIIDSYIHESYGLIKQKSQNLAQVVNDPNRSESIEIVDFLMLQTINRYQAYLLHQKEGSQYTHPEDLFVNLSKLCADLMTFLPERVVNDLPAYNHDQPAICFSKLMLLLRKSLSTMLDQKVIRIPLEKKDQSTYTAYTPDKSILDTANFILAAKADMPSEDLRSRLPNTIKIATVDKIKELVAYHLPGVKLLSLSTAPRELPYHNGYVYFELNKEEGVWELFDDAPSMAFHLAGDFPNIDFEFWAIKSNL